MSSSPGSPRPHKRPRVGSPAAQIGPSDAATSSPLRVSPQPQDDFPSTPKARQDRQNDIATTSPPAHVKQGNLLTSSSDFKSLFSKALYVDKTNAIAEFIGRDEINVHLLLRPRRSGKTTMLSTMKYFLELDRKTEDDRRKTLTSWPAAIMARERFVAENFAQHPVLYLDMSIYTGAFNQSTLLELFGGNLHREVKRLQRLGWLKEERLKGDDKVMIENLNAEEPKFSNILEAPFRLTKLLHEETNKQVIVLIDEYDRPLYDAPSSLFDFVENLLRGIYERLLKGNPHLRGAFIIGVLRVAKSGFLSGLNNVEAFPLHSPLKRYATACMFTEEEVTEMFIKYENIHGDFTLQLNDAKYLYNGYSCAIPGVRLWNPYAVLLAMKNNQCRKYWDESGADGVVLKLFLQVYHTCEEVIAGLLSKECRVIQYRETLDYRMIKRASVSKEDVFGLLLYAGYLSTEDTKQAVEQGIEQAEQDTEQAVDQSVDQSVDRPVEPVDNQDTEQASEQLVEQAGEQVVEQAGEQSVEQAVDRDDESKSHTRAVRIPNEEIRQVFLAWTTIAVDRQIQRDRDIQMTLSHIFKHLCSGNSEYLRIYMEKVIASMSCFTVVKSEAFYLGNIFLLVRWAVNPAGWFIRPEVASGQGCSHITMWEEKGKKGIVIEVKQTPTPDDLDRAAKVALRRINTKNHVAAFPGRITEGWKFGMAFHKRTCRVVAERYTRRDL